MFKFVACIRDYYSKERECTSYKSCCSDHIESSSVFKQRVQCVIRQITSSLRDSHSYIPSALRHDMQIVLINDAFEFGFPNLIRVESELGEAPLAACVRDHTCQGAKHAALVPRVVLLTIWRQKMCDLENVHRAFVRGAGEILVLQVKCEVADRRGCAASAKLTEFLTCRWIKNSDQCSLS